MNDIRTRFLSLLLIMALMIPCMASAADTNDLRGYENGQGYVYVTYGEYPKTRAGETAPILWRILSAENARLLLLSEYVLFPCHMEADPEDYVDYANTEVYEVLNSAFLSAAFTAAQQQTLINVDDLGKVFLPSSDDMKNPEYGFTRNSTRTAVRTGWARVNGAYTFANTSISPYWLREKSDKYDMRNLRVGEGGSIGSLSMNSKDQGVRPCVYVSTAMITVSDGKGTRDDPYVLTETVVAPTATISVTPPPSAASTSDTVPGDTVTSLIDITADPTYDAFMEDLPEDGFVDEGIAQYSNAATGHWVYATTDTYIHIVKHTSPMIWYEADVRYIQPSRFAPVAYQATNRESMSTPQEIAITHNTIFGVSSDGYVQRAAIEDGIVGLVMRAKHMLSNDGGTFDQLAMLSDGSMLMSPNGQFSADDYLDMEAVHILSCGPLLIRNGAITQNAATAPTGQALLAMGEKYAGSLVFIFAEANASSSGTFLAERLLDDGCQSAIVLSSGSPACMVFMGDVITPATSAVMGELLMLYGGSAD